MKKLLAFAMIALACAGATNAQRAGEYDLGKSNSGENASYNMLGLTYNNTSYRNNWHESEDNFSSNGVGLNYLHGFSLSSSMPMYIETGGVFNFNFGKPYSYKDKEDGCEEYINFFDINLEVPVRYLYRFNVTDQFSIAPYFGIDFKLHLVSQYTYGEKYEGEKEEDTYNLFSKDDMDETYNRFQMGWHVGSRFQYDKFSLSVQYGTDFIPFFSYEKDKINTGNFKLTLGYSF